MTSGLTRSLKANTLEGVSSECSFFIVLQSNPLFSILSLLPKDQTLKRVIKQLRESPRVAEHFSHDYRTTLSLHDLASSPRIASAPHKRLVIERPCRVVTHVQTSAHISRLGIPNATDAHLSRLGRTESCAHVTSLGPVSSQLHNMQRDHVTSLGQAILST